jgi:hypothetical protein
MKKLYESPTATAVKYALEGVVLYSGVQNMEDHQVFEETLDFDFVSIL